MLWGRQSLWQPVPHKPQAQSHHLQWMSKLQHVLTNTFLPGVKSLEKGLLISTDRLNSPQYEYLTCDYGQSRADSSAIVPYSLANNLTLEL